MIEKSNSLALNHVDSQALIQYTGYESQPSFILGGPGDHQGGKAEAEKGQNIVLLREKLYFGQLNRICSVYILDFGNRQTVDLISH